MTLSAKVKEQDGMTLEDTPGPTLKCQVSLHQRLAIIRCMHLHHLKIGRLYNILWQSPQKLKLAQAELYRTLQLARAEPSKLTTSLGKASCFFTFARVAFHLVSLLLH